MNGAATSGSVTLTAGSHTITAVYSGDATYAGGPGSLPLTAIAPGAFAVGSLDPTFGTGGVDPIGSRGQATDAVALDNQGRILTVGQTELGNFILSRYTADGQPDLSFGNLGVSPYQPYELGGQAAGGIAIEPDGKIVVMQRWRPARPLLLERLARQRPSVRTEWSSPPPSPPMATPRFFRRSIRRYRLGSRSYPTGECCSRGWSITEVSVYDGYALVMYLPDGQLDTSFNGSGTLLVNSQSGVVQALAVTNNEILVMTSTGNTSDGHRTSQPIILMGIWSAASESTVSSHQHSSEPMPASILPRWRSNPTGRSSSVT